MSSPSYPDDPSFDAGEESLSRRDLVARGARLGLALPAAAGLAGAIGAAPALAKKKPLKGTAVLINYGGWMGKGEVEKFEALHPGVKIKQVPSTGGLANLQRIRANPGAYDFWFADAPQAARAQLAGVVAKLDWSKIPNAKYIDKPFRRSYPWGIPTDIGKTGIAYRKDIVKEEITSWADLWDLAPKYKGQIIFYDIASTMIGSALKFLGYSGNSRDPEELKQARRKLIQIKPYLQTITNTGVGKALANGSAAIATAYDGEVVLAKQKNPNVAWVVPSEGIMAYIEGWIPVKGSDHLDIVQEFLNYHCAPKVYANFVNTVYAAYCESAASRYIKPEISKSSIIGFNQKVLKKTEWEQFKGKATPLWDRIWDEFKSA